MTHSVVKSIIQHSMLRIIKILFLTLVISCTKNHSNIVLRLDVKSKDIGHLIESNGYSDHLNIKFDDETLGSGSLRKRGEQIQVIFDSTYIDGFNEFYVLQDSIGFWFNEFERIQSIPLDLIINEYVETSVYLLPLLTVDNLEVLGNRTDPEYNCNRIQKLQDLDSNVFSRITSVSKFNLNIIEYDSTISLTYFYVLRNPLTGMFTLIPDLERLSVAQVDDRLRYNIEKQETITDSIEFSGEVWLDDTIISNTLIRFHKGTKLFLNQDSDILFNNCQVLFLGANRGEITIEGNGGSIYFQGGHYHELRYVTFNRIGNFQSENIQLPSGITFYNTNVSISNCIFNGNVSGDDYLNTYKSEFLMDSCVFTNVLSDAFDSDFSIGSINNTRFKNIGNDAIDGSGSIINCSSLIIDDVGDKALSAGENSVFNLDNSVIRNSEMAVVVKDGSTLNCGENNLFESCTLDFVVFKKKDFYPRPRLTLVEDVKNYTYLIEENSIVESSKLSEIIFTESVKELLYGKVFGKRTKKS